jgi:excisionase family DNA binding protein
MDRYLTTGQVAQQLKTSTQTVRNYCDQGVINATRSAGGHYRIAPQELERLKRLESLPPVARATLTGNSAKRSPANRNPNELIAEPSFDAIDAAEEAYRSERDLATDTHQLDRLRVRREAVELTDWFANREQARIDKMLEEDRRQAEADEKQIRQRRAQAEADSRRAFEKRWLSYAVDQRPMFGPQDYPLIIHEEVTETLAQLNTDEDSFTVKQLVDSAIGRAMAPSNAIDRAVDSLPVSMRLGSDWKAKARLLAADAVAGIHEHASAAEMDAAAEEAIQPLIRTYRHNERVESEVRHIFVPGTLDDLEEARDALRETLSRLPPDAGHRQFEEAKNKALSPILGRVRARAIAARIDTWVPPQLSELEKGIAFAEAKKAVDALPAGASDDELQTAARKVIERQAAKRRLIEAGLREVPQYAQRLLRRYRYGPAETAQKIEQRASRSVKDALEEELDGSEEGEFVTRLVHRVMRETEGCADA